MMTMTNETGTIGERLKASKLQTLLVEKERAEIERLNAVIERNTFSDQFKKFEWEFNRNLDAKVPVSSLVANLLRAGSNAEVNSLWIALCKKYIKSEALPVLRSKPSKYSLEENDFYLELESLC